jgi:4-amino-4-deoxy-L-arabinose transferase-like glycosyltransferase
MTDFLMRMFISCKFKNPVIVQCVNLHKKSALKNLVLILAAAVVLFFPFLGKVHLFDWDEINFAECAREMLVTGDYLRVHIDFQPFWEKPPLIFWMQAAAMKLFGVNEYAARFPNAVCGVFTLLAVYHIGKKISGERFGLLWALAYAGSLFPNMYFKSGIIDPWFNLFIFLGLWNFIQYAWKCSGFTGVALPLQQWHYALLSGMFIGLAMLMKGQVALLIFGLTVLVYWVSLRFRIFFSWGHVGLFLLAAVLTTSVWFGYETIKNGPWFLQEFITYQIRLFSTHDAGHKGFPGYHYVVLLLGCFPASVLAIPSFFKSRDVSTQEQDMKKWMLFLFWVVTILFSIVKSRIIHYSSMAWFPVTFLGAFTIHQLLQQRLSWKTYITVIVGVIGTIVGVAFTVFPFVAMNIRKLIPYVKDEFAQGNMEAQVTWSGFESVIGVVYLILVWTALTWFRKGQTAKAAYSLFGGTALTIFLAAAIVVPKVERYSQGASIDFLKERVGEDCYVQVLGFKSYAHLFYTQKPLPQNPNAYDTNWLLQGDIDKPVYFVSKVDRIKNYTQYTELKELYRKNGFVFLKREPVR